MPADRPASRPTDAAPTPTQQGHGRAVRSGDSGGGREEREVHEDRADGADPSTDGGEAAPGSADGALRLALLDAAVGAAGEAVLITTAELDPPGPEILFVNPAACRLTGYAAAELVGRTPRILQGPETDRAMLDRLRAQLARGEPFAGRAVNYRKDGTTYVIDWRITPVRGTGPAGAEGAGAAVTHFVALQRDVTDEVRAETERERLLHDAQRARAEAEAASRAKSEFLAVMSHELRTPLNAIGGYAQLMELGLQGPVTPEQLAALGRIQRGQQHLLGLINAVLNYAKLEAGQVEYQAADVPVGEALAEVTALVAPQAHAKRLLLAVAPCAPALVARADAEKLRQVLVNLLSNAVKFTEPGGEVTIRCADGEGVVRVSVEDTGRGIAADQLERVFEPFVQVDARLTRTEDGAGLGLAISRDLARGMGGDLTAESAAGAGSTFTLTLPAA
jgi:PAS domain S-box-containing protein